MRRYVAIVLAAWILPAAGAEIPIKPIPGLVLTTNVHATITTTTTQFGLMDTEDLISLTDAGPDGLTYKIRMSAPSNKLAAKELEKFKLTRKVRREDLEQSSRMTLLYSTQDPETYAGQTFAETSTKVLNAMKTTGESPFVFGGYSTGDDINSMLTEAASKVSAASEKGAPGALPPLGSLFSMLGMVRHYYRGTLRRVEAGPVPFSVLLNGVRTTVPAIHAAGTFTFGTELPEHAEIWWLDNPAYPLNLRWAVGHGTSIVTRIDMPAEGNTAGGGAGGKGASGGAGASMAQQLAGKSCHVELHGIYFSTGSAVLLDESEPMLKTVAGLITASADAKLMIEGHTDNIGSAEYNQQLSERRAEAVRQALVTRYGVPAARLSAKGFGLTRPVETNSTFEGRAHNRRVELSRPCAAGQ
jgi:outer membrane protein OmpA-like peptidoglycan-associated protein